MHTTDRIDLDVTREDLTRRELADRLATIGVVAGGVVHDVRNPLNILKTAIEVIKRDLELGTTRHVSESLAMAFETIGRIETLIACVYAALHPGDGKPVDVAEALRTAATLASFETRHVARVVLDVPPGALVTADRSRLVQVFLKILINAAQAIGEGAPEANAIRVSTKFEARSIVVEISDTGRGMPPHVVRHVFEPFFSTKPAGQGAGLGLFVCHEIVTSIAGSIGVQSAEGRGTTFRVSLPAFDPPRAAMGSEPLSGVMPRAKRSGTVLVIDDDAEICAAVRDSLAPDHRVDTTIDPHYALARLRARIPYDLILCDVTMPRMSGPDLHAEACKLAENPEAAGRFVFITGVGESIAYAHQNGIEVVRKPFKAELLRGLIAARLAARRA